MKKVLIGLLVFVLLIFLTAFISVMVLSDPQPEGKEGPEAEVLTDKILESINIKAWDTTEAISWKFRGGKQYVWNKRDNLVQVSWKEYKALVNLDQQEGLVFKNGEIVPESEKAKLLKNAIDAFNNDSFWLIAPFKLRDPGTSRSIVELKDGRKGLMITYTSGGTTPGDSYVWLTDEDGIPSSYKMWVKILPIGGLEAQWTNWMELPSGAKIARSRTIFRSSFDIPDIQSTTKWKDWPAPDLFSPLSL